MANTVTGTDARETLRGSAFDDLIQALGGNDRVYAGAGNDHVKAGKGNDKVFGSDGDDALEGNRGNDKLIGGLGNNTLYGGKGQDTLTSNGSGFDRLYGGEGVDAFQFKFHSDHSGIPVIRVQDYTQGEAVRFLDDDAIITGLTELVDGVSLEITKGTAYGADKMRVNIAGDSEHLAFGDLENVNLSDAVLWDALDLLA